MRCGLLPRPFDGAYVGNVRTISMGKAGAERV